MTLLHVDDIALDNAATVNAGTAEFASWMTILCSVTAQSRQAGECEYASWMERLGGIGHGKPTNEPNAPGAGAPDGEEPPARA